MKQHNWSTELNKKNRLVIQIYLCFTIFLIVNDSTENTVSAAVLLCKKYPSPLKWI